jgi:hypothetical protein
MKDIRKERQRLRGKINDTPSLLSVLYDLGLLPEQTDGKSNEWMTYTIASAWPKMGGEK